MYLFLYLILKFLAFLEVRALETGPNLLMGEGLAGNESNPRAARVTLRQPPNRTPNTVGCAPPQPSILAARGPRFLGPSCFVPSRRASPRDFPSVRF